MELYTQNLYTLPETQWRVSHWKTVLGRSLSFRFWLSWFSTFYHIIILHLQLTCLEIIKSTISPRTKTKTTCYVCMPCLMFFPQKNKQKKQRHKPFAHIFFILAVILGEQFGAIEVIYFPNWGSCWEFQNLPNHRGRNSCWICSIPSRKLTASLPYTSENQLSSRWLFQRFFIFTPTYLGEDDPNFDFVIFFNWVGWKTSPTQLYSSSHHHLWRWASTVDLTLLLWNCRAVGLVAFSRSASMSFRRRSWIGYQRLPGGLDIGSSAW